MGADIDGTGQFFQRIEIFGEGFPVPLHALRQRGPGNVFHAFHQADQPFVLVGTRRSETDTAIAHDDGRYAVPARRGHFLVPGRLSVVMRVNVDEAGGDQVTLRIDFLGGVAADVAHLGDEPVLHGEIPGKAVLSGTIDNGPVANDQIICGHVGAPLSAEEGSTLQPMSPAPSYSACVGMRTASRTRKPIANSRWIEVMPIRWSPDHRVNCSTSSGPIHTVMVPAIA